MTNVSVIEPQDSTIALEIGIVTTLDVKYLTLALVSSPNLISSILALKPPLLLYY